MTNATRNTRNDAEAVAPTLMVINGDARESANATFIDVENPADHTIVGRVPRAAAADVDAAVHAAAGAF
jgi:acyl-CoA reductase-like NAD-dependent aldehyde dehydrogenase